MELHQSVVSDALGQLLPPGARVALSAPVALWPAGSMGTITWAADSLTGRFDYLVELDAGGSLYFRFDELREVEGGAAGRTAR